MKRRNDSTFQVQGDIHLIGKIFGRIWKRTEEKKPKKILSLRQCDKCKKEFPAGDLHQILEGTQIVLRLCDSCLNDFYGHGALPLDEEEE